MARLPARHLTQLPTAPPLSFFRGICPAASQGADPRVNWGWWCHAEAGKQSKKLVMEPLKNDGARAHFPRATPLLIAYRL
jgi:hypothetical protein